MVTMNRISARCRWWAELSRADRELLGSIRAMAEAIDPAEHYVHIEFFILVQDEATAPVFDALERACQRV